jgi:putative nucleotidyltransferase with HDIG domain
MNDQREVLELLFPPGCQLPTLPVLFYEFCKLTEAPQVSQKQAADLIVRDPAMVAKVLQLCNSAIYCNVREVSNLTSAIILLGLDTLKKLILQISMVRLFPAEPGRIPDFDITLFWEHSLAAAHFGDMLAERLDLPGSEDYYLGGLLHDIGKLALYHSRPADFAASVRLQIDEGLPDVEAEKRALGADHAEIGAFLADRWKFKPELTRAIRDHHASKTADGGPLSALVRVANLFAKAAGLCFPWETRALDIVEDDAWRALAAGTVTGDGLERITFEMMDQAGEVRHAVQLMLARGGEA